MKAIHLIGISLALLISAPVNSQDSSGLMKLVLENNPALKVAREASRTAVLRAGTGNNPPDPELEFGYLFGDPAAIGNKVNIVFKQQLDFPTAYVHRSRLKDIRISRAELEYLLARQDVLSEAQMLWTEQVHLNQLSLLLEERFERAVTIRTHVGEMKDAGEVGALEFSQANLMVASVEGEYEEVLSRMKHTRLAVLEMTGGQRLEIRDSIFPEPALIAEDSLLAAYREGPAARLRLQGRGERENELSLARSQHLPKFSAGYFSEAIPVESFRGFTLGISIPLWENAHRVKTAQSALLHSEAELDLFLLSQEKEVKQKMIELRALQTRIRKLEKALSAANTMDLLTSSLENGEINLSNYYYTSDFYFRNQQLLLRYKRDMLALEADLLKIYL